MAYNVPFTNAGSTIDMPTAKVLLNNGDGTFGISYTATGGSAVDAKDFDGDGKPDLFLFGSNTAIKLGNGDGTFRDGQSRFTTFGTNTDATVGDFNGDGLLDIASTNYTNLRTPPSQGLAMSLGLAGGTFNTISTNFRLNRSNMVAADFNGDGKLDIAGFSFVDYGIGNGSFSPGNTTNFAQVTNTVAVNGFFPPQWVAVGDLDGKGSPDLIATMAGGHHSGSSQHVNRSR